MNKQNRLVGLDLCRAIAAFAVILVHSGDETWGLPISDRAIQFRQLFYFAVPFFLAASFYFGIKKIPLVIDRNFWQKKFQRIVLPYLLWSVFYVVSKTAVFLATNSFERVRELLSDPIAIIFFGAASYHLYFIPLLFAGTILLYLANYLYTRPNSLVVLSAFSILSLFIYQLLLIFNNDFDLGSYTAFSSWLESIPSENILYQPLRILLVNLSWVIRCLPYFAIALLFKKLLEQKPKWIYKKVIITIIFLVFVCLNFIGNRYLPAALCELGIAYSLLLLGITLSRHIEENNLITSLGLCSFGIYLIHPFVKSAVEIVLVKLLPEVFQSVSIVSMLIYSISSFLVSWAVISLIQRNKTISQFT